MNKKYKLTDVFYFCATEAFFKHMLKWLFWQFNLFSIQKSSEWFLGLLPPAWNCSNDELLTSSITISEPGHIRFVELCRTVTTDGNIANQAAKVKITMHIGFVELCLAVTTNGDISNQATEVKMTVHTGFKELCTTVTADSDISNQATEVKMAVHIGFVELCMGQIAKKWT